MMKQFLILAVALFVLAACGETPEPQIVTQRVEVPVPMPCEPDRGPAPDYPDTNEALAEAPDILARVALLLAGRELRIAREHVNERALSECALDVPAVDE